MENRIDARENVFLNVLVYQRGQLLARCNSGNVSCSGLFLNSPIIPSFKDEPLELEIEAELDKGTVTFHLRASIVHARRQGAGLAFKKTQAQPSVALMALLSKNQTITQSLEGTGIDDLGGWYHFESLPATAGHK